MQNPSLEEESGMLSIGRASEYLGVSIDTLRRWEKREKIVVYRSPGGHRYFKKQDLDNLFGTKYQRDETEEKEEKLETKSPKPSKNGKKEEKKFKITTEITDQVAPPIYEQAAGILQRPIRQFSIPQAQPIAIRSAKYEAETIETYSETSAYVSKSESAEVNTLLPKISLEEQKDIPHETPIVDQAVSKTPQSEKNTKSILNKSNLLALLIIASIITVCLALILYFYSQPQIISPLPSRY